MSPTRVYVTVYVGGKPIQCLLDSGCEHSDISRSVVPNARLTHSRYTLSVADKANLPILGDTTLHFEVDGNCFEANVSISPAIDDFLLSSDWLEANGVKWDFTTGTLHFGDRVIHAYRRTLGKVCRRAMVSEDYIQSNPMSSDGRRNSSMPSVPAHHEANVPVKMSDKDISHPTDIWVIETKQLSSRVMTARTLISENQERLIARVCNYSDEPYELKADYYLARAEPVEYIPGRGEKQSDGIKMLSMSTGVAVSTDLLQTAERDPVTNLRGTTVGVSTTAADADAPVADGNAFVDG